MTRFYTYLLIGVFAGCSGTNNQGSSTQQQPIQAGTLSISIGATTTISNKAVSSTLTGTVVLTGSVGVAPFNVTLTLNPLQTPPIGTISPGSCTLSSENSSCDFVVTGLSSHSSAYVTAVAAGYDTVQSVTFPITVTPPNLNAAGILSLSVSPTIAVGFSKTATISLDDSANVSNLAVQVTSSNPAVAAISSNSCTTLSSDLKTCTVVISALTIGNVDISASATGYETKDTRVVVSQFWNQISNKTGLPTTTVSSQINNNATPTFTLATDNASPSNLWGFATSVWTQLTTTAPPGVLQIVGNPTPTSLAVIDSSVNHNLWMYNGSNWMQLTTGTGSSTQPASVGGGGVSGNPTPSSVIVQDVPGNLWAYDGIAWKELTNGTGSPTQPDSPTWGISKNATASFLLIADSNGYLWEYNGTSWTQLTNALSLPSNAKGGIFGNPTASSVVIQDNLNAVWTYNGSGWDNQTDGDQPASAGSIIFGNPTASSIVLESNNQLWTLIGTDWTQITGATGQPEPTGLIARNPKPSSIVISDSTGNLWAYDGTTWKQLSGSGSVVSPNPGSVNYFLGVPTPTSIIIGDSSNNIWSFDGTTWVQLTGASPSLLDPQPASSASAKISIASIPSAIIELDASGNLWVGQN